MKSCLETVKVLLRLHLYRKATLIAPYPLFFYQEKNLSIQVITPIQIKIQVTTHNLFFVLNGCTTKSIS